ncbi:hypothetical protein F2P79_004091 [Pimephales promelas]|nr:hypothetical protein F2P79_004091 [Pimephales promelas]
MRHCVSSSSATCLVNANEVTLRSRYSNGLKISPDLNPALLGCGGTSSQFTLPLRGQNSPSLDPRQLSSTVRATLAAASGEVRPNPWKESGQKKSNNNQVNRKK